MIYHLDLFDFKSFEDTEFALGPFTVLIGANASGKSNLRDAFRFLHGISRGYTLSETIGEKWIEGGALQWQGIRGGMREAPRHSSDGFLVIATLGIQDKGRVRVAVYGIGVDITSGYPRVTYEFLHTAGQKREFFDTHTSGKSLGGDTHHIKARIRQLKKGRDPIRTFLSDRPILTQLATREDVQKPVKDIAAATLAELESMRFLDLNPDAMRRPSLPGQRVLSDRGENLASVLMALYEDDAMRDSLLEWIRELTPMDVQDFDFDFDATGRVILQLVESDGHRTSVYSASDGTLRLLAMIAALLGPNTARFYFLEELEAGIHPARLHLLLDLIEQQARRQDRRPVQIVATTHSPHLLRLLRPETLHDALLVYRREGQTTSSIIPLHEIPGAEERMSDPGRLHESSWFENVLSFAGDGAPSGFELSSA